LNVPHGTPLHQILRLVGNYGDVLETQEIEDPDHLKTKCYRCNGDGEGFDWKLKEVVVCPTCDGERVLGVGEGGLVQADERV
jgi:hypothetical protein